MNLQKNKTTRDPARAINNLSYSLPRSRSGAMEMSVGTIVTIVLLMSVLVLGIFLVQKIFKTGTSAIDSVDTKIQDEIDRLFASDEGASYSTIPRERIISIKQGDFGGFGFSFRNPSEKERGTFSWIVSVDGVEEGCPITDSQAESFIILGKTGQRDLEPGQFLEDAIFVRFRISDNTPLCLIDYLVEIDGVTSFVKTIEIK